MRLKSLSLKNFRCFTDETINFDQYTALFGANNAGKSAAIAAVDIFFRSNPKAIPLSIDDFFKRIPDRELKIQLTFDSLVDEANAEFEHYARGGELTFFIRATLADDQVRSSLHGARFANPRFAPFFEMTTAAEKKAFYTPIASELQLAPWQNQTQAASELRTYESINNSENELIASDDKAFGVEGPVPRLRRFIDFVYIPAVKEAGDEAIEARNTAFSRLIERAVRANLKIEQRLQKIRESAKEEIDAISSDHQEILKTLTNRIDTEYQKFNSAASTLHLEWGKFEDRNLQITLPMVRLEIADDLIRNSISKFGHGTQRNYLTALLMVSATYDFTSLQTLIVACEEPELYQHPPQARILADALQSLASEKTQVIVTTHSPYFIAAKSFENIRVIRRTLGERSKAYQWSVDENCALIAKAKNENPIGVKAARAALNQFLQPQMNEMFFNSGIILVEGEEDKAILGKYLGLTGKQQLLLSKGVHILPVNGKGNFINALAIARGFEIPFYAVFDGDMNIEKNKSDNVTLNKNILSILEFENGSHSGQIAAHVWRPNFCVWRDSIQDSFDDRESWHAEKVTLAEEFGWKLDRLTKNSMVLEAAVERAFTKKAIPHLECVSEKIVAMFK